MLVDSGKPEINKINNSSSGKELLLIIKKNNKYYKALKIQFNKKGDIYFFIPFHKSKNGNISLIDLDYNTGIGKKEIKDEFSFKFKKENNRPKISYHNSGFVQFSFSGTGNKEKGKGFNSVPIKDIYKGHYSYGPRIVLQIANIDKGFQEININDKQKYDYLIYDYEKLFNSKEIQNDKFYYEELILIEIFLFPYIYKVYRELVETPRNINANFKKIFYLPNTRVNSNVILGFITTKINFCHESSSIIKNFIHKIKARKGWYLMGFSEGLLKPVGKQMNMYYPKNILKMKKGKQ